MQVSGIDASRVACFNVEQIWTISSFLPSFFLLLFLCSSIVHLLQNSASECCPQHNLLEVRNNYALSALQSAGLQEKLHIQKFPRHEIKGGHFASKETSGKGAKIPGDKNPRAGPCQIREEWSPQSPIEWSQCCSSLARSTFLFPYAKLL